MKNKTSHSKNIHFLIYTQNSVEMFEYNYNYSSRNWQCTDRGWHVTDACWHNNTRLLSLENTSNEWKC